MFGADPFGTIHPSINQSTGKVRSMSNPAAAFTSAYGNRTLQFVDSYDGTFLDVFVRNTHPSMEACHHGTLHFRMTVSEEQELLAALIERGDKRTHREAMLKDWDEALVMNSEFDQIANAIVSCLRRMEEMSSRLQKHYQLMNTYDDALAKIHGRA